MTAARVPMQAEVAPEPPYYVKGLALGVPAYLIGVHLWTWVFTLHIYLAGYADFRQLYTAGYMVRSGYSHQLYSYDSQSYFQNTLVAPMDVLMPFLRPAYQALLFIPLSLMSYRAAYLTFLGVNLVLLAVPFWLLRAHMVNLGRIVRWLPGAMFLAFLPIAAALIQGQDSILLLALLAAAVVLLDRGAESTAGVLVGLGLFKFQITIPILVLFLAWKRWRFAAGFVASAIVAGGVSLWMVGLSQARVFVRSLLFIGASSPLGGYPLSVHWMANIHGLVFGILGQHLPTLWLISGTLVLSLVVLIWTVRSVPVTTGSDMLVLAISTSVVVSYYLFIHDLSVLLIPIALTLNRFIGAEASGDRQGRFITRVSAVLFLSPICISYAPNHFYLVGLPVLAFWYALVRQQRLTTEA